MRVVIVERLEHSVESFNLYSGVDLACLVRIRFVKRCGNRYGFIRKL